MTEKELIKMQKVVIIMAIITSLIASAAFAIGDLFNAIFIFGVSTSMIIVYVIVTIAWKRHVKKE